MEKLLQEVALKDVRFFAYHGFYPEEQVIGSVFYVDVMVSFEPKKDSQDELANTVNYERLYTIANEAMRKTSKLIETVAENILQQVSREFTYLKSVTVRIKKMNPPIRGDVGRSEVCLSWNR